MDTPLVIEDTNTCRGCKNYFDKRKFLKHLCHHKNKTCNTFYSVIEIEQLKKSSKHSQIKDWASRNEEKVASYKSRYFQKTMKRKRNIRPKVIQEENSKDYGDQCEDDNSKSTVEEKDSDYKEKPHSSNSLSKNSNCTDGKNLVGSNSIQENDGSDCEETDWWSLNMIECQGCFQYFRNSNFLRHLLHPNVKVLADCKSAYEEADIKELKKKSKSTSVRVKPKENNSTLQSQKLKRYKEKKQAYNQIFPKLRDIVFDETIQQIYPWEFHKIFISHCKRAKERQELFLAEFSNALNKFEGDNTNQEKIKEIIDDVQDFMKEFHADIMKDMDDSLNQMKEEKSWVDRNEGYAAEIKNIHFTKQKGIDCIDEYIEESWMMVQDIIGATQNNTSQEISNDDSHSQNYIRKRKPIDFTIEDLEVDNENDKDYVANVPSTSKRIMPQRKCKKE